MLQMKESRFLESTVYFEKPDINNPKPLDDDINLLSHKGPENNEFLNVTSSDNNLFEKHPQLRVVEYHLEQQQEMEYSVHEESLAETVEIPYTSHITCKSTDYQSKAKETVSTQVRVSNLPEGYVTVSPYLLKCFL